VISPGDDPVTEAIDGWLGTYYHRLPLLSPGLLAVGWGSSERAVVLDSGSLSMNIWYEAEASWPFDGMRNVPTKFQPELPNPLPGEDQSQWGYPVTLQVWNEDGGEVAGVTMTLHQGKRDGPTVPSHFSTPGKPTNPEHAPSNAYCLIPKNHLRTGTKYVVVAKIIEPEREIVWEFTTGR